MGRTIAGSTGGATNVAQAGHAPVQRLRLREQLDAIPPGGTGLLVAPAGSGKTVLIGQWMETQRQATVWILSLDGGRGQGGDSDGSDDPLSLALTRWASHTPAAAASTADLVDDMLGALDSPMAPVVLVVDDVHLLDQEMIAALGDLAERLPLHARLVLSSRWDLGLSAGHLRRSQRLVELRAGDLAFTEDEAHDLLLQVSGRQLDRPAVQTLVDRTGGWAAGLQLAGISLQRVDDATAFVEDFAGTDRLVVEYLTDEVLDGLDPATRRFLGRTSVLPWLTAELCDAVTGHYDGRHQLKTLSQRSLFMVPLDQRGHRYRYHPLFAELLRYEFAEESGIQEQHRLRSTASEWLLQHGHVGEALELLVQAEAWTEALTTIDTHGRTFLERSDAGSLVRWLSEIDARLPDAPPSVAINLLAAQIASQQYVGAAETHRQIARRSGVTAGERVIADALYSCLCLEELPAPRVIEVTSEVLASLPELAGTEVPDILGIDGWTSAEAIAECMTAYAHLSAGRVAAAAEHFETVASLRGMQYVVWRVHALGAQGLARAWAGQLREAEQLARHAVEIAGTAGVQGHTCTTAAHLALAALCLERGDLTEGEPHLLEAGLRARRSGGRLFNDLHSLLETRRVALAEGPQSALSRLHGSAPLTACCPLIVDAATALEERMLLQIGRVDAARSLVGRAATPAVATQIRTELALADEDVTRATIELDNWELDPSLPLQTVEHEAVRSSVLLATGDTEAARESLLRAVAVAELDGLRRPFLERPALLRLASDVHDAHRQPFIASLLSARRPSESRRSGQSQLVEPLTRRELAVLELFPTRLTHQEIAGSLYVSVNTVKTHARGIYRKLDASDRNDAVRRARELGLL